MDEFARKKKQGLKQKNHELTGTKIIFKSFKKTNVLYYHLEYLEEKAGTGVIYTYMFGIFPL
jgi:hypothetical protein